MLRSIRQLSLSLLRGNLRREFSRGTIKDPQGSSPTSTSSTSSKASSPSSKSSSPSSKSSSPTPSPTEPTKDTIKTQDQNIIHENGLYYGKFTKEEYNQAKEYVTTQYRKLESEIKGTHNIRENIDKIPLFPSKAPPKPVTDLTSFFQELIKTTGPVSLSAYMRQCLTHPEYGYYTTRDPLDAKGGDFITSPEISSVFGEMVGIWLYTVWASQGSPLEITLVEFGPGRGTLMADVLRVFSKFAKKRGDVEISIVLVEASPILRKEQWRALCRPDSSFGTTSEGFNVSTSKWGGSVTWVDTEKDVVGTNCNYLLAHEFFDALPIKSFVRVENGWRELLVEHTQAVVNTQPKLPGNEEISRSEPSVSDELLTEFHLTAATKETPSSVVPQVSSRFRDLRVGSRIEVCSDAELYMREILRLVQGKNSKKPQGGALIVDYGMANEVPLNSLRGIYKHKFVSPFYKPGEVDLSIDVDFENLRLLAAPHVQTYGPVEQGDWLHELGIGHRFDQLIKSANLMANKELLYDSYIRLTSKDEKSMGKIYKFLGLLPKGSEDPIGFGRPDDFNGEG